VEKVIQLAATDILTGYKIVRTRDLHDCWAILVVFILTNYKCRK